MNQLKRPQTFVDQVEILLKKGIKIKDKEDCENFLKTVTYYRFLAYLLPFRDKETRKCQNGLTFERLKSIYIFDSDLRHLISSAIEDIEVSLRTMVSHKFSIKYGAEGYLDTANFNAKHKHDKFMENYNSCVKENSRTLVVQHHNSKYGGHFPLWVVVDFFHLGMLSHFYADMKTEDQKSVAAEYCTSHQNLGSWFKCLTDLRNRCAHYSRLYFWNFTSIPRKDRRTQHIPDSSLFSQIMMLRMLHPNQAKWNKSFLEPLKELIKERAADIELVHIGFPENWEDLLK